MDASPTDPFLDVPPFLVLPPERQTRPLVLSSPHSGTYYPPEFLALSALDPETLRRSEDTFVETLFGDGPRLGAPLIHALYPRAYVDVNREPYELDPLMFSDPLPGYVNATSPRVAAGLGTLARVVGAGTEIYRGKIPFAEAWRRIDRVYRPYHAALGALVSRTRDHFGFCLLLDCHSMPSAGPDATAVNADVVLGDRHGLSCASDLTQVAAHLLSSAGLRVARNVPYAGGFTTGHYGRPADGVHALQIELARRLYMDEASHQPTSGFEPLRRLLSQVIERVGSLTSPAFWPRRPL